jgi:D-aminoacyl-tRNA deacylase
VPENLKFAIITSVVDPAGVNIKEKLIASGEFEPRGGSFDGVPVFFHKGGEAALYTIARDTVFAENIDREICAEVFIFATRHEAAAAVPTLSAHAPGNFGAADFGGLGGRLCPAPAFLLKNALMGLKALKPAGYTVTMEATHHGPYLEKPAMFIEIGSAGNEWKDAAAGETIASVILDLIKTPAGEKAFENRLPAAAVGGPHYCSAFNKIMFESNYAIGHVCPKYHCDKLDEALIAQMAEKASPPAVMFFIDWKGVNSAARTKIIEIIEKLGYKYERA